MQFWLLTLITQLRKIIAERWRPSCRTRVWSLSSKFCITFTNISCGTVAIYLRVETFRIVDCARFSNIDFWFEVTPKKEIAGRYIWWAWGPRDIAETRDYVLRKHLSNNCHRSPSSCWNHISSMLTTKLKRNQNYYPFQKHAFFVRHSV